MMFLAGIVLFALAIRLLSWTAVFSPEGVMFRESDAIYHMRRVALAVEHHFNLQSFDPYLNYPDGFHCNWPNLFDQTIAAIALVAGNGHPSPELIDTVGAFVPPILGALTCLPVYVCARAFLNKGYALGAAAIFAMMPFHIQLSILGRPDHHVAVVFLAAIVFACALKLQTVKARRTAMAMSLLMGFLLYVSLMVWIGSIVFALILTAHGAIAILLALSDPDRARRITLTSSIPLCLAAILIAPTALRTYWAREGIQAWEALSAFHVEALACCGIGLAIFGSIARWMYANRANRTILVTACSVTLIILGIGLALFLKSPMGQLFLEASHWVAKVDPMFRYCEESMPLSWAGAQVNFTSVVFLFPLLLVWQVFRSRQPEQRSQAILLVMWTLAFGAAAIRQERFSDVLSIFAAILVALFISCWVRLTKVAFTMLTMRTRAWHVGIACGVGALAFYLLCTPTLHWFGSYVRSAPYMSLSRAYELGRWIATHTEPTSGYIDLEAQPEYGVLATWEFGHVITVIGRRPNIANNFIGWHENRDANLAPYRFYIEQNSTNAMAILTRYKVRYLLVQEPLNSGELPRIVDVLGLDPTVYFERQAGTNGQAPVFGMTQQATDTMLMRLYTQNAQGMPAFKLVYESSDKVNVGGTSMGTFKIFRFDPATINNAEPPPTSSVEPSASGTPHHRLRRYPI